MVLYHHPGTVVEEQIPHFEGNKDNIRDPEQGTKENNFLQLFGETSQFIQGNKGTGTRRAMM